MVQAHQTRMGCCSLAIRRAGGTAASKMVEQQDSLAFSGCSQVIIHGGRVAMQNIIDEKGMQEEVRENPQPAFASIFMSRKRGHLLLLSSSLYLCLVYT